MNFKIGLSIRAPHITSGRVVHSIQWETVPVSRRSVARCLWRRCRPSNRRQSNAIQTRERKLTLDGQLGAARLGWRCIGTTKDRRLLVDSTACVFITPAGANDFTIVMSREKSRYVCFCGLLWMPAGIKLHCSQYWRPSSVATCHVISQCCVATLSHLMKDMPLSHSYTTVVYRLHVVLGSIDGPSWWTVYRISSPFAEGTACALAPALYIVPASLCLSTFTDTRL